jgi:hypothetical protein
MSKGLDARVRFDQELLSVDSSRYRQFQEKSTLSYNNEHILTVVSPGKSRSGHELRPAAHDLHQSDLLGCNGTSCKRCRKPWGRGNRRLVIAVSTCVADGRAPHRVLSPTLVEHGSVIHQVRSLRPMPCTSGATRGSITRQLTPNIDACSRAIHLAIGAALELHDCRFTARKLNDINSNRDTSPAIHASALRLHRF